MAKKEKTPLIPKDAFDQVLFRWRAPEFLRYQRGKLWYIIAGTLNGLLVAYAIWSGSWTMALLFVVVPLVYLWVHRESPKEIDVVFSPYGIKFGPLKFAYTDIKKFWIFHSPPYLDELHLKTNNRLHPEVTIQLMGVDPNLLRQYLVTQVPEWEGKQPSIVESIIRILRLN